MKNPNGYGCIRLMGGNRRRPYAFIATVDGRQKYIAAFETIYDAKIFQSRYFEEHHRDFLPSYHKKITFSELYFRWLSFHCDYLQGPPDGRYEGNVVHALPLSFSNACYAALANVAADVGGPSDEAASVRQTTTSSFQLWGEVSLANATITASCVFIGQ